MSNSIEIPAQDRDWLVRTWALARFSPGARNEVNAYCSAKGWYVAAASAAVCATPEYVALTFRSCAVEGCPNDASWLDFDGRNRCDEHHIRSEDQERLRRLAQGARHSGRARDELAAFAAERNLDLATHAST